MVGHRTEPVVVDTFAIVIGHCVIGMAHNAIDRYLIGSAAGNRFKGVPQRIKPNSMPM